MRLKIVEVLDKIFSFPNLLSFVLLLIFVIFPQALSKLSTLLLNYGTHTPIEVSSVLSITAGLPCYFGK